MRVLYFSPRDCWPVTTGARVRDFHLARQLAAKGKLTYIGFTSGEGRPAGNVWRERLEPLGNSEVILVRRDAAYSKVNLVRGLLGPTPISVLNYSSPVMLAELERLLTAETFDAIQIEGVHLFAYVKRIRELAPHARLISDWHNIESELLERYSESAGALKRIYARRTTGLLRNLEHQLLTVCDAHTVCSGRERDILAERVPAARIEVIGNGVDVEFFSQASTSADRRRLVFVGSMDYHANIDAALYFAAEVWPSIRARRPDLEFIIVGSRPVDRILALRTQPGITVTGTVEDVRPYYASAVAVVAPVRVGSGTRLKVLEAMAAGAPVLSTTLGVEGLAVTPSYDVLIADSAAAMADTAVALQPNTPEWRSLAAKARELVRSRYDWPIIGETLRRLYAEQIDAAA
jgi:sugar transferase (PEP-CTERM/EpsH1 system associated)